MPLSRNQVELLLDQAMQQNGYALNSRSADGVRRYRPVGKNGSVPVQMLTNRMHRTVKHLNPEQAQQTLLRYVMETLAAANGEARLTWEEAKPLLRLMLADVNYKGQVRLPFDPFWDVRYAVVPLVDSVSVRPVSEAERVAWPDDTTVFTAAVDGLLKGELPPILFFDHGIRALHGATTRSAAPWFLPALFRIRETLSLDLTKPVLVGVCPSHLFVANDETGDKQDFFCRLVLSHAQGQPAQLAVWREGTWRALELPADKAGPTAGKVNDDARSPESGADTPLPVGGGGTHGAE